MIKKWRRNGGTVAPLRGINAGMVRIKIPDSSIEWWKQEVVTSNERSAPFNGENGRGRVHKRGKLWYCGKSKVDGNG